jgi:cystathionine beta-lyase family protein involved in aluminum resistance
MELFTNYGISKKEIDFVQASEEAVFYKFKELDEILLYNQLKVLSSFKRNKVSERHFMQTTGYGYNDDGREIIDKIYADVLGAQAAIVRSQFFSGTHAIVTALFGVLRPGDTLLSITNAPYATVKTAISSDKASGTLCDFGINYAQTDLTSDGEIDIAAVKKAINSNVKMIYIQRSTGYDNRKAIGVEEIKNAASEIRKIKNDVVIFVDNCYGEFIEKTEPTQAGADLIAGSLIKNIGGGIAQTGGYIAGRADLIDMCAQRINTPGIGTESGANFGQNRNILQGLFLAPKMTNQALKNAKLMGECFKRLGYKIYPDTNDKRSDIIQAVCFDTKQQVELFCKAVQEVSPVDSYVTPYAWGMPGYDSDVIMAAGCFIQGSSIEMSADSPLTEPYTVYFQGGLTYEHGKLAAMNVLGKLNLIK